MNCSFIAYPAELEPKNVLEVFREPIGRKYGEVNADLKETKYKILNKLCSIKNGWLVKRL